MFQAYKNFANDGFVCRSLHQVNQPWICIGTDFIALLDRVSDSKKMAPRNWSEPLTSQLTDYRFEWSFRGSLATASSWSNKRPWPSSLSNGDDSYVLLIRQPPYV